MGYTAHFMVVVLKTVDELWIHSIITNCLQNNSIKLLFFKLQTSPQNP